MGTVRIWLVVAVALRLGVVSGLAAERVFDFSNDALDKTPAGFRSTVWGSGKPGDWRVVLDEVPPLLAPLNPGAPSVTKRAVLAQVARDARADHMPVLVFGEETFEDFKLTTRFKVVGGAMEQIGGVVFRFQNESNFYLIGASALGNYFRCFKVADGVLKPPIGPEIEVSKDAWHEITVECEGNRIVGSLDGKELIKLVDSTSSAQAGGIGFWTMADSACYFVDGRITYTRREMLAETVVRDALNKYPRVLGLTIYAVRPGGSGPSVIASKDPKEMGGAGGKVEQDVISKGHGYVGRDRKSVSVTLPLRDRNGEPMAAVRVVLPTFPGQTEDNALVRAQPVVKAIQKRVSSLEELLK